MSDRLLSSLLAVTLAAMTLACLASSAHAQSPLEAAEAAYLEVDFELTREQALTALRSGNNGPDEIVRIYQLLGIASSALGDEAAARDYFMRMLGVDENATLDDSVPPRLRNPYLEARGAWSARPGRLGLEVGLDRASSAVRVQLRDPVEMIRRVRISARLEGETEYSSNEYRAQTVLLAEIPGAGEADRVEYYVEALDMHGNIVLSDGSAFDPEVVGRESRGGNGDDSGGGGGSLLEDPVLWIIIGAVLVVGAGIGIGVALDQRSRIGIQTQVVIGID
ncbi:MAG: hypothetical protein AB8I08_27670 [Sandaracinaceae bacterium]